MKINPSLYHTLLAVHRWRCLTPCFKEKLLKYCDKNVGRYSYTGILLSQFTLVISLEIFYSATWWSCSDTKVTRWNFWNHLLIFGKGAEVMLIGNYFGGFFGCCSFKNHNYFSLALSHSKDFWFHMQCFCNFAKSQWDLNVATVSKFPPIDSIFTYYFIVACKKKRVFIFLHITRKRKLAKDSKNIQKYASVSDYIYVEVRENKIWKFYETFYLHHDAHHDQALFVKILEKI